MQVQLLRRYRDEVLIHYLAGRWFVRWYYDNGQAWAVRVVKSLLVKKLLRHVLSLATLLITPFLKRS